jgi:hypothetical protein
MLVTFLASILSIPPALAALTRIQANGFGAVARWSGTVGQFSDISLVVSKSSAGTFIFLGYSTPSLLGATAVFTVPANDVQVTGLTSATLSPVTLKVCTAEDEFGNCIQSVPVAIKASWTRLGTPSSDTIFGCVSGSGLFNLILKSQSATLLSPCGAGVLVFLIQGTVQQASATGTWNGQSLGQAPQAYIIKSELIAMSSPRS